MEHLPGLIADLALILVTGAITTILFRAIKQPLVLGYVIAGFVVGPYLKITPTVSDIENVEIWAEIGVIFLLFSLGLEFSFRKLSRIGGSASITAIVEIIFIVLAGYFLGQFLNWSAMDSIFLGGMLASSSTTIISKAFDELKVKTQKFAGIVVGVLIVEDLLVILLMVLMSTLSVTRDFAGADLMFTILKLLFFLIIWFIAGIFIIPTILKKTKNILNEETLLILSIGLCLLMVVLATRVGFSAELGAFIMGSILAETTSSEKIEHVTKPVKDFFGAVFFVSVGMMINPAILLEYAVPVLLVTLLVLGGKFFSTTGGAIISGQPLKQSMQVGMSMAQVGEFAFIVASLGLSLGVTSDFLFPVAVGVSAITTFTTPYMIKYASPFHDFLVRILPSSWVSKINAYSSGTQDLQSESIWKKILKEYTSIVLINGTIVVALFLLFNEVLLPFTAEYIENELWRDLAVMAISLLTASPFLWAVVAKQPGSLRGKKDFVDQKSGKGPLLIIGIARLIIGILLVGLLLDRLFSASVAFIVSFPVILLIIYLSSGRTRIFHDRLEKLFLGNLFAKSEPHEKKDRDYLRSQIRSHISLEPWDVHLVDLEVNPDAPFIGKTFKTLAWREIYGINIMYIKRGDRLIFAPGRDASLNALDHAGIIGTDAQMQAFRPVFEARIQTQTDEHIIEDIVIQPIAVEEHSRCVHLTIGNSGLRDSTNGLIIGLERRGKRIINPDSSIQIEPGDVLWIAGERKKIEQLRSEKIQGAS